MRWPPPTEDFLSIAKDYQGIAEAHHLFSDGAPPEVIETFSSSPAKVRVWNFLEAFEGSKNALGESFCFDMQTLVWQEPCVVTELVNGRHCIGYTTPMFEVYVEVAFMALDSFWERNTLPDDSEYALCKLGRRYIAHNEFLLNRNSQQAENDTADLYRLFRFNPELTHEPDLGTLHQYLEYFILMHEATHAVTGHALLKSEFPDLLSKAEFAEFSADEADYRMHLNLELWADGEAVLKILGMLIRGDYLINPKDDEYRELQYADQIVIVLLAFMLLLYSLEGPSNPKEAPNQHAWTMARVRNVYFLIKDAVRKGWLTLTAAGYIMARISKCIAYLVAKDQAYSVLREAVNIRSELSFDQDQELIFHPDFRPYWDRVRQLQFKPNEAKLKRRSSTENAE